MTQDWASEQRIEIPHGSLMYRLARRGGPPVDNGGSNSARKDASRLSVPSWKF
jgi:hypothetical protein